MRKIFKVLLTFIVVAKCYGQDTLLSPVEVESFETNPKLIRKYFFKKVNFVKEGKELVVIVKEPQTKLAEDLGYRIYNDTSFLNKIESEFYQDVDPTFETAHFCGHDIYFYIKSGSNLKLFKQINSRCGLNDELSCENIGLLAENGLKLNANSLTVLDFENLKPKEIISNDVIYAEFISSDGIWQGHHPMFYNNCSKPNWLYDGTFQIYLEVDQITPIYVFIQQFFSHIDSFEFKNINYALEHEDENQLHIFNNTSTRLSRVRLNVYLDKDCFHYFSEYTIKPNNNDKKKIDLQGGRMILIK